MTQTNQNTEKSAPEAPAAPENNGRQDRPKLSRRSPFVRWGVAAVLVLLAACGIGYYIHSLSFESTDDAFINGDIVAISPRVSGHVARVYARDNRMVHAGDLLLELDPRDFEARLDAAGAALEAARAGERAHSVAVQLTTITSTAELDEAGDSVESARAAVQKAGAGIALAKAALDQARAEAESAAALHQRDAADLKRYREMEKTRTVSPQDLDHAVAAEQISAASLTAASRKIETQTAMVKEAEAAHAAAEANLRQASARLAAAQSAPQRIQQSRSQADVSRADINKAEAELAQARLNLSYTKIYAPSDGFVTKKAVEPGQFVQTGQSLLAIVPQGVWVTANFKETQLTRMKPGQSAEIVVDTYPDLKFHGHVDSIQRGTGARFSLLPPENATGNYVKVVQRIPVKIVFDRPEELSGILLAPGMSVVPDVDVRSMPAAASKNSQKPQSPSPNGKAGTP